ncbi:hypothetical protein N0V90_003579 [Kalmusia sp. IMI 367209]|nr:hypothetical protein N0V90_003579 [Kalmusia sp. IMI 367209]
MSNSGSLQVTSDEWTPAMEMKDDHFIMWPVLAIARLDAIGSSLLGPESERLRSIITRISRHFSLHERMGSLGWVGYPHSTTSMLLVQLKLACIQVSVARYEEPTEFKYLYTILETFHKATRAPTTGAPGSFDPRHMIDKLAEHLQGEVFGPIVSELVDGLSNLATIGPEEIDTKLTDLKSSAESKICHQMRDYIKRHDALNMLGNFDLDGAFGSGMVDAIEESFYDHVYVVISDFVPRMRTALSGSDRQKQNTYKWCISKLSKFFSQRSPILRGTIFDGPVFHSDDEDMEDDEYEPFDDDNLQDVLRGPKFASIDQSSSLDEDGEDVEIRG